MSPPGALSPPGGSSQPGGPGHSGDTPSVSQQSGGEQSRLPEDRVVVGVVRRPYGFDGSIAVSQHSSDPDRFKPGDDIIVDGAPFSIEAVKVTGRATVLKLASVNSEEQAGALRGKTIEVDVSALPPPPPGAYYHYQIIGARVVTVDGEELGRVVEILETGSNDVYVVRAGEQPADGKPGEKSGRKAASAPGPADLLVPALKDVIVSIDVERGLIQVDLPEGLR